MQKGFVTFALCIMLTACSTSHRQIVEAPFGNAPKGVVERSRELGSGFRRVIVAELSHPSFESIGHFEYLYYKDLSLARIGNCSVAPSGNYAVYQDGNGAVFLFRRADEKIIRLTDGVGAYASSFDWREEENRLDVNFAKRWKPKRTYALQ